MIRTNGYGPVRFALPASGAAGNTYDRSPLILPEMFWEHWLDPNLTDTAKVQAMTNSVPDPHLSITKSRLPSTVPGTTTTACSSRSPGGRKLSHFSPTACGSTTGFLSFPDVA